MVMRRHESLPLPAGAIRRKKMLPAEDVERVKIAPDGVHVEFLDGTSRTYRAKNLMFELPEGHEISLDALLRRFSIEGYVTV